MNELGFGWCFDLIIIGFSAKHNYCFQLRKGQIKTKFVMKINFLFYFLFMTGLSACSDSYQYDVYATNKTDAPIKIVFKSPEDQNNPLEQMITLRPGEQEKIISTKNIALGKTMKDHTKVCQRVATYVKAFQNEIPGKLQWCDKSIRYERTDIGQAEFIIEYTANPF